MFRWRRRSWLTLLIILGSLFLVGSHPQIAFHPLVQDPPRPPPLPQDLSQLEQAVQSWERASPEERAAYGQWLRVGLEFERAQVQGLLEAHAALRSAQIADTLDGVFNILKLLSLGLMLLPVVFWRRYRGHRRRFLTYCGLATFVLFLTFLLFQVLVTSSVSASAAVLAGANPQAAMADAAFDRLDDRLERWIRPSSGAGMPVGPTVGAMRTDASSDFVTHLIRNLEYLDLPALEPIARASQLVYRLVGFAPVFVPIVVTMIFLLTTGFVFRRILTLPFRAAYGEERAGRDAVKLALRVVWRELLAVLAFILSLAVPTISLHLSGRYAAYALFEGMLAQSASLVDYMGQLTSPPAQVLLTIGLLALPVLLLLTTLMLMASTLAYTVWARRLTQLRFHRRVSLRAHGGFWRQSWLRLFRMQWSLALLLWAGVAGVDALVSENSPGAPADALQAILWRGGLLIAFVAVGALLAGLHRDLWWFVRFRPAAGARPAPRAAGGPPALQDAGVTRPQ